MRYILLATRSVRSQCQTAIELRYSSPLEAQTRSDNCHRVSPPVQIWPNRHSSLIRKSSSPNVKDQSKKRDAGLADTA